MYHEMKGLIANRVFTILVLSAYTDESKLETSLGADFDIPGTRAMRQFFVVQLPVDLSGFPPNIKSRSYVQGTKGNPVYSPPKEKQLSQRQTLASGHTLVAGRYASVETVNHVNKGPGEDARPRATWSMSTLGDIWGLILSNLYTPSLYRMRLPTTSSTCATLSRRSGRKRMEPIRTLDGLHLRLQVRKQAMIKLKSSTSVGLHLG